MTTTENQKLIWYDGNNTTSLFPISLWRSLNMTTMKLSVRLMSCWTSETPNQENSKFVRPHHIIDENHPFYRNNSLFRGGNTSEPRPLGEWCNLMWSFKWQASARIWNSSTAWRWKSCCLKIDKDDKLHWYFLNCVAGKELNLFPHAALVTITNVLIL